MSTFGSKADMTTPNVDVCFTPTPNIDECTRRLPKPCSKANLRIKPTSMPAIRNVGKTHRKLNCRLS